MIIGEHSRGNDLEVNVLKGKQLTNIRAAGKDEAVRLTPPRRMTLEQAIAYIEDDELVEVTPKSIRLRKRFLNPEDRKRAKKQPPPRRRNRDDPLKSRRRNFHRPPGDSRQGQAGAACQRRGRRTPPRIPNSPPARRRAPPPPMRARARDPIARSPSSPKREKAERPNAMPQQGRAESALEAERAGRGHAPAERRALTEQKAARDARYAARKARK